MSKFEDNQHIFNHYYDNIPAYVYLKDTESNYFFINKKCEELFNITREEIANREYTDFDFFDAEMAKQLRENDKFVMETGKHLETVEIGKPEGNQNIELMTGHRHYLALKFPLQDSDSNIIGVCGFSYDITEQKKLEAELKTTNKKLQTKIKERKQVEVSLRESEEKFRSVFDDSLVGMILVDKNGQYVKANQALSNILGYSQEELLSLGPNDVTYPGDVDSNSDQVRKMFTGESNGFTTEKRYLHKDGHVIWSMTAVSPVRDYEGNIKYIISKLNDITKRKQTESALSKAKDELEKRVQERTNELEQKTIGLEESNIALKVLMKQRETDKKELEKNILFNVNKLIGPSLKKLKEITSDNNQKVYLEIIESNLNKIVSPFAPGLSANLSKLTPAEIQIADFIRHGKTTKEIAIFLGLSPSTIAAHRQNIRKKLALTNKEINLQTALTAIS